MPRSKTRETRRSGQAADRKQRSQAPRDAAKKSGNRGDRKADLWGRHAVFAALANPRRRISALWALDPSDPDLLQAINGLDDDRRAALPPTIRSDRDEMATLCGIDAIHQGIAAGADPLSAVHLEDVIAEPDANGPLLVLDQVTDPHNVGAILRSAAALGARAVVVQDRHAPQITGTLARIASGAVEVMPLVRVGNLARAIDTLKTAGFWVMGLDERGPADLARPRDVPACAIVLGAEGDGLRRLTRESCDVLVKLPTHPRLQALNVSNAAAIALWECWARPDK